MNKVVRFRLICQQMDEFGNEIDYRAIYRVLGVLQRQTREIKNKAIQICWNFQNRSVAHHAQHGVYLKEKDEFGMTLRGYLNSALKSQTYMYSANVCATTDTAYKEFTQAWTDILRGDRSILSYKKNQPLELHNKSVVLNAEHGKYTVKIKLFNKSCGDAIGYHATSVNFLLEVRDKSQQSILDRCLDGMYKVTASKLLYHENSHRWVLNLGYSFEAKTNEMLEADRILGVDLGIHYPICASVYGEYARLTIDGGEIDEFRRRVEARKRSLQHQGKYCGEGRVGHGRNTRCLPVDRIEDKIARFRDTCNHKYSKKVIEFAISQRCATIQMEDLTGIASHADRFLKNWSYYDLQTKIEYKAQEAGIKVVKVSPKYTSQRCSKCGTIARENRPSQQVFCCTQCGYEANADYNASQNLSIAGIERIIEKELQREP